MGCGKRPDTASAVGLRSASTQHEGDLYELASYPECDRPYRGAFQGATIYIVGYGTEEETLFRRADRGTAARLAREKRTSLTHVPAIELCEEAMLELLGA